MTQNTYSHVHGFEDYNVIYMASTIFEHDRTYLWLFPYSFDKSHCAYLINKDLPVKVSEPKSNMPSYYISGVEFSPELVTDHKALLKSAKKVYTHQCCKLSRSMLAEKYKKSLNPFLSDAVIIPKPDYSQFDLKTCAIFINEQAKIILVVRLDSIEAIKKLITITEGTKLRNIITLENEADEKSFSSGRSYKLTDLLDAEFFYYGKVLCIPNKQLWALEALTYQLPNDKIVFEDSVQESLSNDTNKLDFESLCAIMDMLNSSDQDTVSAGLKSLSMMDWAHYSQSIKYILSHTNNGNWKYNKACNSVSVRYMLKTITGNMTVRSRWPGKYDATIYEEDFELFKKLKCYYEKIEPQNIINYIRFDNFMYVDSSHTIVPNLKQRY